jgi:abequosyltransferase
VEIVVLDGASTDNTADVVSLYQQDCAGLVYSRQNFKGGVDSDMVKAVELARGEYCWFISADDVIKPGSLKRVLSEIETGNDVYLCNRTDCDINMVPFGDRYFLKKNVKDSVFNLHNNYDLVNYLRLSTAVGALFSFISSLIFKRSGWIRIPDKEYAYGTCYCHAFILLSLIHYHCTLKYIREPLVSCRIGNDSFSKNGFFRRILLDFDGYGKIADKLFSDDPATKKIFMGILKKEHSLFRLFKIRALCNDAEWEEIGPKLIDVGYKPLTVFICGLIKADPRLITNLVKLKQGFGKRYNFIFSGNKEGKVNAL